MRLYEENWIDIHFKNSYAEWDIIMYYYQGYVLCMWLTQKKKKKTVNKWRTN